MVRVTQQDQTEFGEASLALPAIAGGSRTSQAWWTGVGLFLLVIGAVLVRWPFLRVPMITDEGGYAYVAHFWGPGSRLYREIPFSRPEGIFLVYKLIFATFGASIQAIRLFAAVYNAFTLVALFLFVRRVFSPPEAWISATLYAVVSSAPLIEGFTANAELFTLLPLVIAAYATWSERWALAGLASAVAFVIKPSGIEGIVLAVSWVVLSRAPLRSLLLSVGGFAAGLIPSIVHGATVGWASYWDSMVVRRAAVFTPGSLALGAQLGRFASGALFTASAWLLPAVLFAIAASRPRTKARLFGLTWVAAAFIGMASGAWWDWHFFIQIVPPLCFLAGVGLRDLPRNPHGPVWVSVTVIAAVLFIKVEVPFWTYDPTTISTRIYGRYGYVVADDVARYVASRTASADPIYVAFGQAEIYYLSQRRAAVPGQMYYAQVAYSDRDFNEVMKAIDDRVPAMIVVVQPPPAGRMSPTQFVDRVRVGYDLDRSFGEVLVFRRRGLSTSS